MSYRTAAEQSALESLQEEYRERFERWAAKVEQLQVLSASGAPNACTVEAQWKVDAAERAYRATRDRLAANLMAP